MKPTCAECTNTYEVVSEVLFYPPASQGGIHKPQYINKSPLGPVCRSFSTGRLACRNGSAGRLACRNGSAGRDLGMNNNRVTFDTTSFHTTFKIKINYE